MERRILDATLRCIARWGVGKTTLDDIAREAGCSRATVYRQFPGGKDHVVATAVDREIEGFFVGLTSELAAVDELEDLLVRGITYAGRCLLEHDALQFMLSHEPELVLPAVAFQRLERVLRLARARVAPLLEHHLGAHESEDAAEWLTRIVLSYAMCPAEGVDVRDDASIRHLVRTYVLPGLLPTAVPS